MTTNIDHMPTVRIPVIETISAALLRQGDQIIGSDPITVWHVRSFTDVQGIDWVDVTTPHMTIRRLRGDDFVTVIDG